MKYINKIVFLLLLSTYVNATYLQDNIANFIGQKTYQVNKFLILNLFKNEKEFYTNKSLKYVKIFEILKENGLMHLKYENAQDINIIFDSQDKTIKTVKTVKDVLLSLGYSYYFTKNITRNDDNLNWKIAFKSESMLDPFAFVKELNKLNVKVLDINKIDNTTWKYKIDVNYVNILNSIDIAKNELVKLRKPHRDYVLRVKDAHKLKITSHRLNTWYPSLAFYDKNLTVIGFVEQNRVYKGIKLDIPNDTKYILLSDTYNLINIKRGLTIIVR